MGLEAARESKVVGRGEERNPKRCLKIVLAGISAWSVWLEVPPSAAFSLLQIFFFSVTKLTLDNVPWL